MTHPSRRLPVPGVSEAATACPGRLRDARARTSPIGKSRTLHPPPEAPHRHIHPWPADRSAAIIFHQPVVQRNSGGELSQKQSVRGSGAGSGGSAAAQNPLIAARVNVASLVLRHAVGRSADNALREYPSGRGRTFGELADRVTALGAGLEREHGIRYHGSVAVLSRNRIEYMETYLACALRGVMVQALNWRLSVAELSEILRASPPKRSSTTRSSPPRSPASKARSTATPGSVGTPTAAPPRSRSSSPSAAPAARARSASPVGRIPSSSSTPAAPAASPRAPSTRTPRRSARWPTTRSARASSPTTSSC